MEVVKVNNEITEYRYYEWNGYTPLGMIIKVKNDNGEFETKVYQFITNHRGDVLIIRDSEDQEVGSYQYDAYGNVLTVEGTVARENPIRYAGYYYDEETKNYYLQARYYNPANGSFLALDPHPGDADEPLSQNGYTYANNNPVMNVDPSGELPTIVIGALVGALSNILLYLADLVADYGKKFYKHIKYMKLFGEAWQGALTGALGGGVTKLARLAKLNKIATLFLQGHVAPAAYLISDFGKYSRKGFTEHQILSTISSKANLIWRDIRPIVKKIYNKYKKYKNTKKK